MALEVTDQSFSMVAERIHRPGLSRGSSQCAELWERHQPVYFMNIFQQICKKT
jgi:hypothetical protein